MVARCGFAAAVELQSFCRAQALVEALRLAERIEAWEFDLNVAGRGREFCFVGCAVRFNHLVMIGSDASAGLIRACEEPLDHGADEIPAFAVQQFLAALRSESSSPKRDRETRLYRELESIERELKMRGAELKRTIQERNRRYGAVVHDLRKPRNTILGYTEILLDEDSQQQRPEVRQSLRRIQASNGDAVRLIDTLIAEATDSRRVGASAVEHRFGG